MTERFKAQLISGGHKGTEAEFSRNAELWKITDTTLSYEGHVMERSGKVEVLSDEDLARGSVSMEIVRPLAMLELARASFVALYSIRDSSSKRG